MRRALEEWGAPGLAVVGLWWAFSRGASFDPSSTLIAVLAPLALYLAGRGWRLPCWLQAAALAIPASVLLVALIHGDAAGTAKAARVAAGAFALLGAVAWATTPRRRSLLAAGVAVLGLGELQTSIIEAIQAERPGLFFNGNTWQNQFGAMQTAVVAVTLPVAVLGRWRPDLRGTLTAVSAIGALGGIVGVLGSGSRSALLMLIAVVIAVGVLAVAGRRWAGLRRWAALSVGGVIAIVLIRVPWLLAADGRLGTVLGSGYTASSNPIAAASRPDAEFSWMSRLDFWRVAAEMGLDHPIAGVGNGRYGSALGRCYDREIYASDPHNEWLRSWAEGGIIQALPMLAVLGLAIAAFVLTLRSMRRLAGPGHLVADPARWGAALAMGVLLAHAAFDFDWLYTGLVALTGLLGGMAAQPLLRTRTRGRPAVVVGLGCVLLVAGLAIWSLAVDPQAATPTLAVVTSADCPAD